MHGLQWNRHSDHLTFVPITDIHPERHDPKRQLISLASRLFDPLGSLAPFTIRAKRLFQSHWLKDDQLPIDINSVWCQWKRELHTLESVGVQRALMVTARDQVHQYELQVFADASEAAYCAVAYVMMESLDGIKVVRFCITKTCVTLVKRMSLPRLESMSTWNGNYAFLLTDPPVEATVLLSSVGSKMTHEVAALSHRENPADKLSHGCALDTLREDKLWWNGPAWLKKPAEQWPHLTMALWLEETHRASPDRKRVVTLCASLQEPSRLAIVNPSRYGTMERLVRITAYCCRFLTNVRAHAGERNIRTRLSLLELQDAEKWWVRAIQAEAFPVSKTASGPIPVRAGDPLATLPPFVDTEGLLRDDTALVPPSSLFPLNGLVFELIVRLAHESELHAGLNQILAALRVGLDFAAPLYVKDEQRPALTAYICLFTCIVTRAVHLEVVFDMTTARFLAAFR
ncbi:hypothetical protein T06_1669 [Trichinella sp. T6]|nr:hypothetical protein T06_1669 [Trichinella sp. T6]